MDVIDVDSSDSCEIDGFSRNRPPTSRNRPQPQQRSVPHPILVPRPKQQQQRQQPSPQKRQKQQRLQNREYKVVDQIDLISSDEEDGEIVEDNRQNANGNNNGAGSTVNSNLNFFNTQNGSGIELDRLSIETLQIKRENIEQQLKQEDNGLEPVSDVDEDENMPPNSNTMPAAFSTSLEDVSDDEVAIDSTVCASNSNRTPMKSNSQNQAPTLITSPVEMKPNLTPRHSTSNTSMQIANSSAKRAQSSPNQSMQLFSESLENVSDDEWLPLPRSKKPALNLNEKPVVFSTKRPATGSNQTQSKLPSPNNTGKSSTTNRTQQSVASNTPTQLQKSPPNRTQISPNHQVQSHHSHAPIHSPRRSQISQNQLPQSNNSNTAKKIPIHSQAQRLPTQHSVSDSSSSIWNKSKHLNQYGIYFSSDADVDATEVSQSFMPNQEPSSLMSNGATTLIPPHRMHSHQTDPLPIANRNSPNFARTNTISNDMPQQNVKDFVRQKAPAHERSPEAPESGIAASDVSSDFELDLYTSNPRSKSEPPKIHRTAPIETHTNLNNNTPENRAGNSNNNSDSGESNLIRNELDLDNLIGNSVKTGFVNFLTKIVAKKRKTPSSVESSSDSDEDLVQPLKMQPANSPIASHSGNCSKKQRNDPETDTGSETSDEESNNGVDTQIEDPTYEPDTEDMEVDKKEDENDAYDSDWSGMSNETVMYEEPRQKPVKGECEESSRDSDETIIDFGQYYPPNETNVPQPVEEEDSIGDTELLVRVETSAAEPSLIHSFSTRNTDKTLYPCSEKAKICPLCNKCLNKKLMVYHFKACHPNDEIFISRISPKMVDYIAPQNESQRKFIKFLKRKGEHLQSMCIFCEEIKTFSAYYWIVHMAGHTGEYVYMCEVCGKLCSHAKHCNITATKLDDFELRHEHLIAYRCKECNFVQKKIENIRAHLATQHGLYDGGEENFQVFTLLPAFRSLTRQNDPNEQQQQIQDVATEVLGVQNNQSLRDLLVQPQRPFNRNLEVEPQQQQQLPDSGRIEILHSFVLRPANQMPNTSEQPSVNMTKIDEPQSTSFNSISRIKADPDAVELLLAAHRAYKSFKEMNPFKIVVRPYILEDYARKLDIDLITQFALYKCMHDACLFACDSEENWIMHMEQHSNLIDLLGDELKRKPKYKEELLKFCECPYCGYEPSRRKEVVCRSLDAVCRHMDMEHQRNTIQCAHCYYRTNEMDNIIIHMERYHPNCKRQVLLCGIHREFQDEDLEELKYSDQHITRVKCNLFNDSTAEKCTKEFACFITLRSHQVVDHGSRDYICSCHTQMENKANVLIDHFVLSHPEWRLEEFQCLYCDEGFVEIEQIRQHMCESHPSKFLLIGTRRCVRGDTSKGNDDDSIQMVYIGDSKDYSGYQLMICVNRDALNSMNPRDLNPHNMYKARQLQSVQYPNVADPFSGPFPPILFAKKYRKELNFLTYKEYLKKLSESKKKCQTNVKSKQAPHPASKAPKVDKQNVPMVTLPTDNRSNEAMPSTSTASISSTQRQRSPEPTPSTSKTPTTKLSTEYVCITDTIYENLMSSHKFQNYRTRLCCHCTKFFKIENETGFQKYLLHLKHEHACKHAEPMKDPRELINHRLKYHRKEPIVAMKIDKCHDDDPQNQWLVHKIINARFECKTCVTRFSSTREVHLHNAEHHSGIFECNEIVFESTVIKSTDLNQPIYSTSEVEPLILMAMFKCDQCRPIKSFRQKSLAVQHHNECHSNVPFEMSLQKFVQHNHPPPNTDMECSIHAEYLFKCVHCKIYFASLAHFERHSNCNGHGRDPQFEMERLVKCAHDKKTGTFRQIARHNTLEHSDKPFTPVNLFCQNQCGLCEIQFENLKELNFHYQMKHPKVLSESITNDLLDSMELKEVSVGECFYTPGCCYEFKCKGIDQIVQHVSVCNRRFKCTLCSDRPALPNLNKFTEHCQQLHQQTKHDILSNLHDIKQFLLLISDLHVIFPNGLHVTVDKIADTEFYVNGLMPRITAKASDIFKREDRYI